MVYYLFVCRSLTYAQRVAATLERAGVSAYLTRTPRAIAGEGCGHGVKVPPRRLPEALRALDRAGMPPQRLFALEQNGSYREVTA